MLHRHSAIIAHYRHRPVEVRRTKLLAEGGNTGSFSVTNPLTDVLGKKEEGE